MRDLRYWYTPSGFAIPRDTVDYCVLGFAFLFAPIWGPFYLIGQLAARASVRSQDVLSVERTEAERDQAAKSLLDDAIAKARRQL